MTYFLCDMNTTTKEDIMAMVYLLLGVWLFVRLGDHGVVFVQPFLLFPHFRNVDLIFVKEIL